MGRWGGVDKGRGAIRWRGDKMETGNGVDKMGNGG